MSIEKAILHIGHNKTGSSFIQSSLALNIERLLEQGIVYPAHPNFEQSRKGHLTFGNIVHPRNLVRIFKRCDRNRSANSILFSSELLFWNLVNDIAPLVELRQLTKVTIVLFIRNPFEHAVSEYGQVVKRGGFTGELPQFLKGFRVPLLVEKLIDAVTRLNLDIEFNIYNYSNHRDNVFSCLARCAGIDATSFVKPDFPIVNRSLTRAEIQLQRSFNEVFGVESHKFISHALCSKAPHIASDPPYCSRSDVEMYLEKFNKMAERANRALDGNECYAIQDMEDVGHCYGKIESAEFFFSREQIEVLVRSVSDEIRKASSGPG